MMTRFSTLLVVALMLLAPCTAHLRGAKSPEDTKKIIQKLYDTVQPLAEKVGMAEEAKALLTEEPASPELIQLPTGGDQVKRAKQSVKGLIRLSGMDQLAPLSLNRPQRKIDKEMLHQRAEQHRAGDGAGALLETKASEPLPGEEIVEPDPAAIARKVLSDRAETGFNGKDISNLDCLGKKMGVQLEVGLGTFCDDFASKGDTKLSQDMGEICEKAIAREIEWRHGVESKKEVWGQKAVDCQIGNLIGGDFENFPANERQIAAEKALAESDEGEEE